MLQLTELASTARCNKLAWSEILFAGASPLREMLACTSGKSLKVRDTSVTGLPRSMSGEGAAHCPGEEKEPLALFSGTVVKQESRPQAGTAGRWQDRCHLLPVRTDGRLAAKETRVDD